MQVLLYRKGADRVEEGFTRDELAELIADPTNTVWVDLRGQTPEQIEEAKDILGNVFKFHRLTIEDCIETRNQPKVEGFDDYLYFIVHGIRPGETDSSNFTTKELDGYLGPNYVVTFHVERFYSTKVVKQKARSSTYMFQRGAAFVLHQLLDQLVDLYMPVVDDFDRNINELEARVLDKRTTSNAVLSEIMDVRRAATRLRRISARQLDVLNQISRGEFEQVPENLLPFYRDIHDHLVRITDLAEGYRDLVSGLFDIHFAVMSNKANDVMKTLAVVSAIILPLSLIAGIYGMNFENMPELKTDFGYYMTLAAMVTLAVALLFYFWKKGWIFQREEDVVAPPAVHPEDDWDDA